MMKINDEKFTIDKYGHQLTQIKKFFFLERTHKTVLGYVNIWVGILICLGDYIDFFPNFIKKN